MLWGRTDGAELLQSNELAICTGAPAAIAKHRRLGGLTVRKGFSHNSGGWRCQQVWFLGGLSPQLADGAFWRCPRVASPLCTRTGEGRAHGGLLLLRRTPVLWGWSSTLWPHLTLTTPFQALSPNITVPFGLHHLNLWRMQFRRWQHSLK